MACYHPMPGLRRADGSVQLHPAKGTADLELPCGSCLGCRSARASQWAERCVHEARCWSKNSFVTLTYDDASVPVDGNLNPREFSLFVKRLRRAAGYNDRIVHDPGPIRFFGCGEYGSSGVRPHYHVLLFNCAFSDAVRVGKDLTCSATLSELWPFGLHRIGDVTGASANYVARYSLKPLDFDICDSDGVERVKPFLRMSRRPGIGATWLESYASDLRHGYLVARGVKTSVPRAYVRRLEAIGSPIFGEIEDALAVERKRVSDARLADAELIHQLRYERSPKPLS